MFAPTATGDKKIAATDDKLMKNKAIEPKLADRWRKSIITLKPSTKKLAWSLGYSVLEHGAVLPPKRAPETLSNASRRRGLRALPAQVRRPPAPRDNTPEKSGLYGGLLETVATLRQETSDHGRAWVKHGEARCLDTRVVYASLTEWTKPRLFVDKTPGYAPRAKMLAIVRHPHACVESWRELWQKNNRLQNKDADVPWATVEASYVEQNENIRRFLRTVPKDRRLLVTYEGLVTDPRATLSGACEDLLGVPYDGRMAYPYDSGATATFQASKGGVASTDPKLLKHKGIDPKLRGQAGLASTLARGEDGAPAVVVLYDGLGFKYGSGLRVPAGHALVACQAPELADPTLPAPAGVEARGARRRASPTPRPRPHAVLVGYSFGGVVALPLRGALRDAHAIPTKALLLVDPMPFGSAPGDVASADGPLLRAARGYDTLLVKFKYVDAAAGGGGLAASTSSGDVATTAELAAELRSHLPSRDAFDELTRVAHFLDTCDMAFDWQRAAPLGDVPVHFFKTAGGPAHFARRKRANCAHRDGVYGWTALEPAFRAPTVVLDGGHFEAFRGAEKLEALAAAGAQKVGMLAPYKATPGVVEMFEHGSRIFGIDLLKLVEEGPAETLDDTRYSQVCVFLTSMAAVKTLERDDPDAVARCSVTAGFSLGEYSALTFAGVMDLDTALTLLKLRGEAMGAACDLAPSGMMTVIGLEDDQLEALMAGTDVTIANQMFLKARPGLKTIVQPVSGAFHSPFMATAAEKLGEALAAATFRKPAVYSNVDGRPHADDADAIKRRMKAQLTAGVMWQDTIDHIGDLDAFYEPAPGKQLASMMRRIDAARHAKMRSI
ncbi:[acyl-carrier-protein] S-malonyltransferase [Aureococcus anophagefferens]|nr:[acyl-carrier-protein] S-malonyltransferase [Aureococcus anophagefferens]